MGVQYYQVFGKPVASHHVRPAPFVSPLHQHRNSKSIHHKLTPSAHLARSCHTTYYRRRNLAGREEKQEQTESAANTIEQQGGGRVHTVS